MSSGGRKRKNNGFSKEITKIFFLNEIICIKVRFDAVKRKSDFFLNHNIKSYTHIKINKYIYMTNNIYKCKCIKNKCLYKYIQTIKIITTIDNLLISNSNAVTREENRKKKSAA